MEEIKDRYEIKVYKIWFENTPEEFYVGSTQQPTLARRMTHHRTSAKRGSSCKLHRVMREKGLNNFNYCLVASCMVSCRDEQRQFEQEFIDKLKPSLNMCQAYTSPEQKKQNIKTFGKEYRNRIDIKQKRKENDSKPHIKLRNESYRNPIKEKIHREHMRRICICGVSYIDTSSQSSRHYNTKHHTRWVTDFHTRLTYLLD